MNVPQLRFKEFSGEWATNKKLGSYLDFLQSGKSKEKLDDGEFLFYGSTGVIGYTNIPDYSGAYLLVARVGANAGSLYAVDGKFSVSDNTLMLKISEKNNFEFFKSLLEHFNINKLVFGSGQPLVTGGHLKEINVSVPTLPEQTKIANFLTTIDERINQLTRKKELMTQYKQGVMQQIFSQQLRFKDDNGEDFGDWEEKRLCEIASKAIKKNKDESIKIVLTNSAVQGIVNQTDYFDKDIANQNNLAGYYIVHVDDFIYNPRISVHAPVGPIKRNQVGLGVMSPLYTVFRFSEGNKDFLEYFFETYFWHEYLQSVANTGARHDRMNISNEDFYNLPIPYPCINEQTKIAKFLTAIDAKIQFVTQQIEVTKQYKQGLLQQMFV